MISLLVSDIKKPEKSSPSIYRDVHEQCNVGYEWIQDKVYTHVLIQGSKEVRQIQFPASFTCRQDAALYRIKDPGKTIYYFFIIWGLPSTKLKAVVCATIYRRTIEVVGVIYRCGKKFTRANESIMLFLWIYIPT